MTVFIDTQCTPRELANFMHNVLVIMLSQQNHIFNQFYSDMKAVSQLPAISKTNEASNLRSNKPYMFMKQNQPGNQLDREPKPNTEPNGLNRKPDMYRQPN